MKWGLQGKHIFKNNHNINYKLDLIYLEWLKA